MARAKTSEPSRARSKVATIEDLTRGVGHLQELLAQVEDLGREGFPYLDAAKARTDLQFRECIRRTFGEKSTEFQEHRNHRLLMDGPEDTRQSIALIKTLIAAIEQKKRDLQGGSPSRPIPPASPVPPIPAPALPQMTVVPASISTMQMTMTQTGPIAPLPVMTTNLGLTPAATVPSSPPAPQIPPAPSKKLEPLSPSTPVPEAATISPAPVALAIPQATLQPVVVVASESQPPPQSVQPARTDVSLADLPTQPPQLEPKPTVHPIHPAGQQPKMQEASPVLPDPQPCPSMPISSSSPLESKPQLAQTGSDHVELVKTVCRRFHAVVRQLRLREEYRATFRVEDEVDAQDLLHALLRIQFNDIDTDEWTPSYSSGAPRTTLLLDESRLAVIVKKTRPGLTTKDLTDQLRTDSARYRFHGRCGTLLCFMYDPDGRIGNPQGLESSLTSVNDSFVVDVLVAPK